MAAKTIKAAQTIKATTKSQTAKAEKSQTNPYRALGGYWSAVEALKALGLGKMHKHETILPAYKKAMGAKWKEFAAKEGKLSADERALVNVMVTARPDYGQPLNEAGFHVRWDGRAKEAGLFKGKAEAKEAKAPKAEKPSQKPQPKAEKPKAKSKAKTAPKVKTPRSSVPAKLVAKVAKSKSSKNAC